MSLSALCLTILVVANHAVETLASRLKDSAVEAIATEKDTDLGKPKTDAEKNHNGCKYRLPPHRRHKEDFPVETAASTLLYDDPFEDVCAQCNSGTKPPVSDKQAETSPANKPSDTTAAETTPANKPSETTTAETSPANNSSETTAAETSPAGKAGDAPSDTSAETRGGSSAEPTASEPSTRAYNWYCKNNDNHARPAQPSEFKFLTRHDGYWIGKEGCGKVLYLTFDAGYENGNVAKILDILKAKNVPGAFFILEHFARSQPQLVKRMADEGHLVCNHTANHKDMTKLSESEFTEELVKLEKAVKEHAGVEVAKFYRPPSGSLSERDVALAQKLGYKTIMWSYAYADWDNKAQPKPDRALEKLLGHTHEGMVLLLHPTSATNAEILDDFIDRLLADGWRFGTLTELTSS